MTEDSARVRFLRSLAGAHDPEFVRALLDFGSETDDNTACVERVGLARLEDGQAGLTLRSGRIPVADMLNTAEGTPVPDQVTAAFPEVAQEDWDAVLRLATLVLVACQGPC